MSKTDKLLEKLRNGTIKTSELQTLLKKMGWINEETEGSHQQWYHPTNAYPDNRMTVITSRNDLHRYQIKEAQTKILKEEQ